MPRRVSSEELIEHGAEPDTAPDIARRVSDAHTSHAAAEAWNTISRTVLTPSLPYTLHRFLYDATFADWDPAAGPVPAWIPSADSMRGTNIARLLDELSLGSYDDLHRWSVERRPEFWHTLVKRLGIELETPYDELLDPTSTPESPRWLPGARLNIASSCFHAEPDSVAIVFQREGGPLERMTVARLQALANRVANGLTRAGFTVGDAIAIDMPMTAESVAIYLGIVQAGCAAVSIADSFASHEIAARLRIAQAKGIFTQDHIVRGPKRLPLFERVAEANAARAIVIAAEGELRAKLRPGDLSWDEFLSADESFEALACDPDATTNILFSSGTTGDPKAIPWTHTTPIKAAVDGHVHHDIRVGDVVAWPTNLGWMMGPWLIYASLIGRATIALYYGAPSGSGFARFVEQAGVTMLGVIPSIVKAWRRGDALEGADWSAIRAFSSTGEASNEDDYLFLMSRAGYRPVIEYCGGTEIGGGYLCGTVVQPASPATFSTPAIGLAFDILDEHSEATNSGEVFLVPPSIGLSTTLLNRDHHEVYFAGTPRRADGTPLRRHGDQIERLPGGYFRAHGRVDDTMNLGGIKVSSAEIERVLDVTPGVAETAAIAISPAGGGPSRLVIYAVLEQGASAAADELLGQFRHAIKTRLNPLFKAHDVVIVDGLPRTASNKVMRRSLRAQYRAREQP